jgi:hypothetical protein
VGLFEGRAGDKLQGDLYNCEGGGEGQGEGDASDDGGAGSMNTLLMDTIAGSTGSAVGDEGGKELAHPQRSYIASGLVSFLKPSGCECGSGSGSGSGSCRGGHQEGHSSRSGHGSGSVEGCWVWQPTLDLRWTGKTGSSYLHCMHKASLIISPF